MSGPGGEMVPAPGTDDVALLAAALRQDTADLETYGRVLVSTLADALPEGCLSVERDRSLADRVAGRPGAVRVVRVRLGDQTLVLSADRGRLIGTIGREVRGVAISSRVVALDEWTTAFAEALAAYARENAAARGALERLLGP